MKPLRIIVLVSGNGTNLQALIDQQKQPEFNVEIHYVFSDKFNTQAEQRCNKHNIPFLTLLENSHRETFLLETIQEKKTEILICAGYMRILSPKFVQECPIPILNIHPSLLPKYKGLQAQKQALEAGDTKSGCTVHYVDEGVDTGEIIAQVEVPIYDVDDVASLSERIQKEEHGLLPEIIQLFCNRKKILTPNN